MAAEPGSAVRAAPSYRVRVEHDDGSSRVLVAVDDAGEVLGLAGAGVGRDPAPPTPWELYTLHTVAAVHGTGLADALLDAALGGRPAFLWVLVGNARAQAFYRRHAFVADGSTRAHEGSGEPEQRMVRHP